MDFGLKKELFFKSLKNHECLFASILMKCINTDDSNHAVKERRIG
jgi:hypothetical protein